jgi:hypothetical protein
MSPSAPPGGNTQADFGPQPVFRNQKDWQLSGYQTGSDTQYPDGYLGTMSANRRQDKILGSLSRMNARQYSRGVHKGERINAGDYIWPDEFNLYTALEYQAQGLKFAPTGAEPVRLTNDGKVGPRGISRGSRVGPRGISRDQKRDEITEMSLQRQSQLKALAPNWR